MYAARAVFASCPSSYDAYGCSEPENISVTAGEDIHFNAAIVHIPGGNCGFEQAISNMVLKHCYGSNIDCTSGSKLNGDAKISAITSPERLFKLSSSTIGDSGVYQVNVTGTNPQDGAQFTFIAKTYRVTVKGEH